MSADLVLSHFSLGRHVDFATRVRAAAEAGFVGIGLWLGDYRRLRAAGSRDADLRAVLDHHGLRVVEYEALRGWAAGGAELAASRADEAELYRMADALGSDAGGNLQVLGPYPGTVEQAGEALAGVADRAAEHGLNASIEFLPEMTNIADAGAAWELARLTGRPNAGVCVDSWHHFRGAADLSLITSVPAERVFVVQLNDGPRSRVDPDYYTDCTRHRLPPGDGDFHLATLLRALADMGVPARYSVEVLSAALLERTSPADLAQLLAARTRELLARTFTGPAPDEERTRA
jgi:sugar phosphate isomerase/epimerase